MRNKSRHFSTIFILIMLLLVAFTCLYGCNKEEPGGNEDIISTAPVTLTLLGRNYETWPALENVITQFEAKYDNCTIVYEYLQGDDSVMKTRLMGDTDKVDIFFTNNVQADSIYLDCAADLLSGDSKLDVSKMNQGLVDNFRFVGDTSKLYAIPIGGEMRGMYVNKTLLNSLNLRVPTNRTELLACCETLLQNGYIPFQGDPAGFAQQLLYPMIANKVVNGGNYEADFAALDSIYDGISEYFRDIYRFLYEDIMAKNYFDYARVQDELGYKFSSNSGKARDFLNVTENGDGSFTKKDDVGKIAFMTDTQAYVKYLDTEKSDFASGIEYEFILAPVGEQGGYAYLSPSVGVAINKKSDNIDWAARFMEFFFTGDVNKAFAATQGSIPNTEDALIKYNCPAERTCTVGQVTFSYKFYNTVITLINQGYSNSYVATNAKYIAANPGEEFYRKDTLTEYKTADADYRRENPTKGFYKKDGETYTLVEDAYILAHADETFYYKSTATNYLAVDADYRTANPTETIYRHVDAMVSISKMNAPKYSKDVVYTNVDAAYIASHTTERYFYKDSDDKYVGASPEYRAANPSVTYYRISSSPKFTLKDYLDRLELEFQKIKQEK